MFVTGGNTLIPNFDARLRNVIRPILPPATLFEIVRPADVHLDAWRGMAKWSRSAEGGKAMITRAEYDEYGVEYFKDHSLGNCPW